MKAQIIGKLVYLALIGLLCAAIVHPDTGFAPMAVTAMWLLILITIALSVVLAGICTAAKKAQVGEAREKYVKALRDIAAKTGTKGPFRKAVSWTQDIAIVCLSAYAGLVVTAIVFCLAWAMIRLSQSMVRDAVKAADAEVAV
jgi:hypothetical protein